MNYNFAQIEKKWQDIWDAKNVFAATDDYTKPKYYALVEFPYPSGKGLHVGHPRSYTALDIVSRKPADGGLQRVVSHGMGCLWLADRKLCH